MLGVAAALAAGLAQSPPGAWRGELIMTGAVFCMAFYNVLSRPLMQRSSALGFLTVGMGAGAAVLVLAGIVKGSFAALRQFTTAQWIAGIYLGIGGGALAFILWVMALARATPTRVANTMTVNPIAATLLARAADRRADHAQSSHRAGRRVRRHLDRDRRDRRRHGRLVARCRDRRRARSGAFFGFSEPA